MTLPPQLGALLRSPVTHTVAEQATYYAIHQISYYVSFYLDLAKAPLQEEGELGLCALGFVGASGGHSVFPLPSVVDS